MKIYRAITLLMSWLLLVMLAGSALIAVAEEDPSQLQARAVGRIDAFIDHFLKTDDYLSLRPELDQAEQELRASHSAFVAGGNWASAAKSLLRLGQIQRMRGDMNASAEEYRQAETAAERVEDPELLAQALIGLARAETCQNDYSAAETHVCQAIRLSESLLDRKHLFDALDLLALIYVSNGDLNAAIDPLNRAFKVAGKINDETLLVYGHFDRAEIYLKRAEKCDYELDFEPCLTALNLARADYREALHLASKLGYSGLAQNSEHFLNEMDLREKLILSRQRSTKTWSNSRIFEPKGPGNVLVTEHFVTKLDPLPPEIEDYYRNIKKSQQQAGGLANIGEALNYHTEGMMQGYRGNQDAELVSYLQAVKNLEQERGKLRDERNRSRFLENKVGAYYAAILQLLERRRHTQAFELMESVKSRALADLMASRDPETKPEARRLYGDWIKLKSEISAHQSDMMRAISKPGEQDQAGIVKLGAEITSLEQQLQALESRLKKDVPQFGNIPISRPATLAELQQAMQREGFEMLQYLVLDSNVILWHVSASEVHVVNVFLPRSQVREKVQRLQQSLANPTLPFDVKIAQELYIFLYAPVKQWIRSERLLIVPHEDLHYIPFQVLQDPENSRFLGETHAISYAPSATVHLSLTPVQTLSGARLLAVSDPDISHADEEVETISKLYPDNRVAEGLARVSEVKDWVAGCGLVHLSVHGKFYPEEPLLSYLQFEADGHDNGRLTAAEMFGLNMTGTRLVVLSACETGRAEATHGNELQGMLRALLFAGANGVVSSYWPVESEATAFWMRTFHMVAQKLPPVEAARHALMAVKEHKDYAHPYYWAAFQTVSR